MSSSSNMLRHGDAIEVRPWAEIRATLCTILRSPPQSWNDLRGSLAGPMHEVRLVPGLY